MLSNIKKLAQGKAYIIIVTYQPLEDHLIEEACLKRLFDVDKVYFSKDTEIMKNPRSRSAKMHILRVR